MAGQTRFPFMKRQYSKGDIPMTFAALLLGALAPTVSAQSDAIRVDALLKDLSIQSRTKLECAPDVGREAVVVQFRDEPSDEVLDRLAKVVGAEWSEREGARRLHRSPELLKREAAAERSRLAGQWKLLFDGILAEIEKMPPVDDNFADILVGAGSTGDDRDPESADRTARQLLQTNPAARTVAKLLAAWDPARFFELRIGERVVFSDVPTAMQRGIPRAWNPAWSEHKRNLELLFRAKERAAGRAKRLGYYGLPELGPSTLESGYGKTVLSLSRFGQLDITWTLITVDRQGQGLFFASGRIPDAGRRLFPATPGGGAPLEFTPEQRAFAFMSANIGYASAGGMPELKLPDGTVVRPSYGISMAESQGKPPDLGLAKLLSDPVERDPAGPLAGELLRQIARKEQRPLIALVSDGGVLALMRSLNGAPVPTDKAILSILTQDQVDPAARIPHAEVLDDSRWMLLRPYFPVAARQARFDRGALKSLFQALRLKGSLTLADGVVYLRASARPTFGSLDMLCLIHANPQIPREDFPRGFSEALAFLAALTPAQIELLEARGSTLRDLAPAQRETIRRWVFDGYRSDGLENRVINPQAGPLAQDPTERYPNGLPLDATVRLRKVSRPAVQARMESGFRFNWDAGSFVLNEQRSSQGEFLGAKADRVIKGFRPAVETEYILEVQLEKEKSLSRIASEFALVPGAPEVQREGLPPKFLAQVEAVRKALAPSLRPPGPIP